MKKFDKYFLMKNDDVKEFVKQKTDLFKKDADLEVTEIGDGNLNYVFRVKDKLSGKSVIVKHAGESIRIDSSMSASVDRNRIESEILIMQYENAPEYVPQVFYYDTVMSALVMEDLYDYEMMRTAMIDNKIFPNFAEHVTTFMVETQLPTTDMVENHKVKKENVRKFINPDLCEISEDLVLTEPFNDVNGKNKVSEGNEEFVNKELYNDDILSLEVAKLKFKFMNYPQALIHGDLHTGSIFVNEEHTKIFDPEFAFYGPIGYDLGNVIANLIFAWANGYSKQNKEFCNWVERMMSETIDIYKYKAIKYLEENTMDVMGRTKGFIEYYVNEIIKDSAAYAGTELVRRVVGMAQVKDITSIEDFDIRLKLERAIILTSKDYIINRGEYKTGDKFVEIWKESVNTIMEI